MNVSGLGLNEGDEFEELKSHSSKWMKTKGAAYANFSWQNGYEAFSVNPGQVERVIQYIANQKEHHPKKAFKTEYQEFLAKNEVSYDERYVWD